MDMPANITYVQYLEELGCDRANRYKELAACLQPRITQFHSELQASDRFLIVLRDPIALMVSAYYFDKKPAERTQEGLDRFVADRARGKFLAVAAYVIAAVVHVGVAPDSILTVWVAPTQAGEGVINCTVVNTVHPVHRVLSVGPTRWSLDAGGWRRRQRKCNQCNCRK